MPTRLTLNLLNSPRLFKRVVSLSTVNGLHNRNPAIPLENFYDRELSSEKKGVVLIVQDLTDYAGPCELSWSPAGTIVKQNGVEVAKGDFILFCNALPGNRTFTNVWLYGNLNLLYRHTQKASTALGAGHRLEIFLATTGSKEDEDEIIATYTPKWN